MSRMEAMEHGDTSHVACAMWHVACGMWRMEARSHAKHHATCYPVS